MGIINYISKRSEKDLGFFITVCMSIAATGLFLPLFLAINLQTESTTNEMEKQVRPHEVQQQIESDKYFNTDKTVICVLTTKTGFEIVGTAHVQNKSDFDLKTGKQIARDNAFEQLWRMESYLLQKKLSEDKKE